MLRDSQSPPCYAKHWQLLCASSPAWPRAVGYVQLLQPHTDSRPEALPMCVPLLANTNQSLYTHAPGNALRRLHWPHPQQPRVWIPRSRVCMWVGPSPARRQHTYRYSTLLGGGRLWSAVTTASPPETLVFIQQGDESHPIEQGPMQCALGMPAGWLA